MPLSKKGERYFPDTPKDEKIMVDNMKWMLDAVVDMRKHGILDEGNGKDNAPIVSQDLIGNFINELNILFHKIFFSWSILIIHIPHTHFISAIAIEYNFYVCVISNIFCN